MEIKTTMSREYIIFLQDEYVMEMSCDHKFKYVFDELTNMPKLGQVIISLMNDASIAYLQDLGVKDIIGIIILEKKVMSTHGLSQNVQNNENILLKKVKSFKNNFIALFQQSFPPFGMRI